jgi:hypothetical protein
VTGDAVACTTNQALLGEGLGWDDRRDEVLGVDILGRTRADVPRPSRDGRWALYRLAGLVPIRHRCHRPPGRSFSSRGGMVGDGQTRTLHPTHLLDSATPAGDLLGGVEHPARSHTAHDATEPTADRISSIASASAGFTVCPVSLCADATLSANVRMNRL